MSINRHVFAGAILTGWVVSAAAQDSPAAVGAGSLEEIVVTAQKREQSLQDVPIAISALSADALEQAGVQDMYDVAAQVPSLSVQTEHQSDATRSSACAASAISATFPTSSRPSPTSSTARSARAAALRSAT